MVGPQRSHLAWYAASIAAWESSVESAKVTSGSARRPGFAQPDLPGLSAYGGNRRVPGPRREEVAMFDGVSVDYYVRLEGGDLTGASDSVLEALARALQLDDAERPPVRPSPHREPSGRTRRRAAPKRVRPSVQQILEAINAPAWVRKGRADVVAMNTLGRALYAPVLDSPARPTNTARFTFLDPRANESYADWERTANDTVGGHRWLRLNQSIPVTERCRSWPVWSRSAPRQPGPERPAWLTPTSGTLVPQRVAAAGRSRRLA
jgi:MmyB-like transcription regulator ligand binding domain/Helix-turn-helix domain